MTARTLLLLRHAKSSWDHPGLEDHERPLSPRGRRAAPAMAAWLRDHAPPPDQVLCSDAVRTRETWSLVGPVLDGSPVVETDRDFYLAGAGDLVRRLRRLPDSVQTVLVVGHNPGLHDLALALTGEASAPALAERLRAKLPTAGLVILQPQGSSWTDLARGSCRLAHFMVPKRLPDARERRL